MFLFCWDSRAGTKFSGFFFPLCSLNSFGLIEQGGKLNRELSRLLPEISRICLQQQEMVITVDQGIRLLPYGFAKYTVRVNHFHLYFLLVCQAVCLVSSPPKSEFRKRVKLPLSYSFFVVAPPVRSFPYPPNICHCPICVPTTSYHDHQLAILYQKDINLQIFHYCKCNTKHQKETLLPLLYRFQR